MFRSLPPLSARELGKWCGYALVLLLPGSFVVLPVLWLVRLDGVRARTRFRPKGGLTLKHRELFRSASPYAEPSGIVQRLRSWWRPRNTEERYLADATDLADLERRMRVLERGRGGPAFVTFNH